MPPRPTFSALLVLVSLHAAMMWLDGGPLGFAAAQETAPETPPGVAELPDDPAAVIAVVGQTPILLGDIKPKVEARIQEVLSKTDQQIPEAQLRVARVNLTRGLLRQAIQNKMMRECFLLEQVGTQSAQQRRDADQMMKTRARKMFHESEIPQLKEQYGVHDLGALDEALRAKGSSLAARQRNFIDAMLGHLYIRSKVDEDPKVSIAEIVRYYEAHREQYEHEARARWEQLTVLFENFENRQAAHQAISAMGREAYFGGNMQAVARDKSQEPFGPDGGVHDWTPQGSLASAKLDEQIFAIPVGKMSQIITDEQGFHIVRVLEREPAGVTPLSEVQDEIRAKLRQQKIDQSQRQVMQEMRDSVPVWSLFPQDIPGANPLPTVAATPRRNRIR